MRNFLDGIYARVVVSIGAFVMGAYNMVHPPHGIEHFFCLALGLLLAFFGIFGFRTEEDNHGH